MEFCERPETAHPPEGSILAPDIVDILAHQYRWSTGLKLDKLTDKHFVEFVGTFLEAIGEARKRSKDYALEAIKYSLRPKRKKVSRRGITPLMSGSYSPHNWVGISSPVRERSRRRSPCLSENRSSRTF